MAAAFSCFFKTFHGRHKPTSLLSSSEGLRAAKLFVLSTTAAPGGQGTNQGTDSADTVLSGPEAKRQRGHLGRTWLSLGEDICVLRK